MPAKEEENNKRRERREQARAEALEMIRKNGGRVNTEIMRKCMQAINITPNVIARVISLCRKMGVQVIVAPYEADAEVAYLCRTGVASCAISEDSDLLAYGCPRVWYKLDKDGKAVEIVLPFTNSIDGVVYKGFLNGMSHRMFVIMCVLGGTDYDDGNHIYGMGIKIAHRLVLEYNNVHDLINALAGNVSWNKKLPMHISKDDLALHYERVTSIFLHNIVYDIQSDTLLHINPIELNNSEGKFDFIVDIAQSISNKSDNFRHVALGFINPKDNTPFPDSTNDIDDSLIKDVQLKPKNVLTDKPNDNKPTKMNLITTLKSDNKPEKETNFAHDFSPQSIKQLSSLLDEAVNSSVPQLTVHSCFTHPGRKNSRRSVLPPMNTRNTHDVQSRRGTNLTERVKEEVPNYSGTQLPAEAFYVRKSELTDVTTATNSVDTSQDSKLNEYKRVRELINSSESLTKRRKNRK